MYGLLKNFHFEGQHSQEHIVKIVRRHWFNILQQYFFIFLGVIILGAFPLLFSEINSTPVTLSFGFSNSPYIVPFFQSLFALLIWVIAFIIWIDYYFDVWIITNERIVNIEQRGLFIRQVSELKFSNIQDVTTEVQGLIPTLLNFGNVYVQTAGTKTRFNFRKVPNPYKLKALIMNMKDTSCPLPSVHKNNNL